MKMIPPQQQQLQLLQLHRLVMTVIPFGCALSMFGDAAGTPMFKETVEEPADYASVDNLNLPKT